MNPERPYRIQPCASPTVLSPKCCSCPRADAVVIFAFRGWTPRLAPECAQPTDTFGRSRSNLFPVSRYIYVPPVAHANSA